MIDYRGRTALITGASSGIGVAFAEALASKGADLVLVARSEERLNDVARRVGAAHGVRAEVIVADLGDPVAVAGVRQATEARGISVDVLVNNAGFGSGGRFDTIEADRVRQEIAVDVSAVAELTRAYLPDLVAGGWGVVINVASKAAFLPLPNMAVYAAAKAFVLSFSQALWAEMRPHGVRVVAVCPGPVDTAFFDVLGTGQLAGARRIPAAPVVDSALRAVERGRFMATPRWTDSVVGTLTRLLPRRLLLSIGLRVTAR